MVFVRCVAATGFAQRAVNWPQVRGPNASGVSADATPPVHFGPETNVLWKAAVPSGLSAPVVWGNRVFLTGLASNEPVTLAYDATHGRELWRRTAPAKQIESRHSFSSPAASTPCTDGERVYACFGSFDLVAYDFEGRELWRRAFERLPSAYGTASSPILAGEQLILQRDGDSANAQLIDRERLGIGGQAVASPVAADGRLYVVNESVVFAVLRAGDTREVLSWGAGSAASGQAFVVAYDLARHHTCEARVNLDDRRITSWRRQPGVEPPFPLALLEASSRLLQTNEQWLAALRRRGISDPATVESAGIPVGLIPGRVEAKETLLLRNTPFLRTKDYTTWEPVEGLEAYIDMSRRKVVRIVDHGVFPKSSHSMDFYDPAVRKRAGFIDPHFFATRFDERRRYAAGDFPAGSHRAENLRTYAGDNESLVNQDVVAWYTLGVTHVARPEDFPVMPAAHASVRLLPKGFFPRNPALEVPDAPLPR